MKILLILILVGTTFGNPVSKIMLSSEDPACDSDIVKIQQITFHQSETYDGPSHSFCSNQPDIQSIPGHHQTSRILCVDRGVHGTPGRDGIIASGNIGRICVTFPEEFGMRFTSVRYLASSDLSASVLSLYQERYKGPEFRLNGNEVRLPEPIPIRSFAMTGKDNLTVYSNVDFSGESACISPGKNDPLLSGVTFSDIVPLQSVGSIRKGCDIQNIHEQEKFLRTAVSNLEADPEILRFAKIEIFG